MLISIIITVKNEEKSMPHLLDSLIVQEKPFEVIIVDANSDDNTQKIVKDYSKKYDFIHLLECDAHKSKSRNYGVKQSKGEAIAFTDGNCKADPNWLKEIRKNLREGYDIVAGKTIHYGFKGFTTLKRVPLLYKGNDASYPTCNIAYKKQLFNKIKGFDPWFKEAEDVDLNYRALTHGGKIVYNEKAIIYHTGSENLKSFIKKSFWYGFGRKELSIRHGSLASNYNILGLVKIEKDESIWKIIRLFFGFLGYLLAVAIGRKPESKERLRKGKISKH
jgi:glycosyltransferase involved in cell wall biosynthesis